MQQITDIEIFNRSLATGVIQQMQVSMPVNLADVQRPNLREISDCIFESQVTFDSYRAIGTVKFIDCIFKEKMTIIKSTFAQKLIFINCIFENELKLKNIQFEACEFNGGSYQTLSFEGTINAGDDFTGELSFLGGKYETVSLACKVVNTDVIIKGGTFESFFCFNSTFNYAFSVEGPEIRWNFMYIRSCNFMDRVDFRQTLKCESTTFNRVSFHQMVIFTKEHNCESITLGEVTAKQNVGLVSRGNVSSLSLEDCDFTNSFNCYDYSQDPVDDHSFSATLQGFMKGNIIFEDIVVSSITINCNNFGNIVFRNTDTHLITIKNFLNYNKLTFANLRLVFHTHVIIIFDSNIDKTEFVNVDFRKFKEIVIAGSEVSNIILSNSILPPRIQIGCIDPIYGYTIAKDENINDNIYYRENYRQLKQAMEKQGNRSAALLFKSKEMHYLRQELTWGWDKLLLYMNYLSNNHGLSWTRGLLFTLTVSTLMFILFELCLGKSIMNFSRVYGFAPRNPLVFDSAETFTEFLSSFPLYKVQSEQANTWQLHSVIMLSRILVGYGVYQTIAAFRKFAGK